jgi:hypothetical protein
VGGRLWVRQGWDAERNKYRKTLACQGENRKNKGKDIWQAIFGFIFQQCDKQWFLDIFSVHSWLDVDNCLALDPQELVMELKMSGALVFHLAEGCKAFTVR